MAANKAIERRLRLEKGYKTKLNRLIKKIGFGGIETIAQNTGIHRDTVTRISKEGKCNRTNKAKIEKYIDTKIPNKT